MKAISLAIVLAIIMITLTNVQTTQAIPYEFTPISYPGATETGVIGLNDLSQVQVVGEVYLFTDSFIHGFIYKEGGFAPLFNVSVSGATHTTLNDINDAGKLVGHYDFDLPGYNSLGFLYAEAVHTDIVPPGGTDTQANSINNSDIIVGETTIGGKQRGFIYDSGTYTFVDYPGADGTRALGISDNGTIVGLYSKDGTEHGFIYSEGTYSPLDVTGAVKTRAEGVNNAGQVVGFSTDSNGSAHGFLYYEGIFTPLDFPGRGGTSLFDINNAGQIVGRNGENSMLATPVPVPSAVLLLGSGLAALVMWRRRFA
jgi:probable HAF family extracellular repeat protein